MTEPLAYSFDASLDLLPEELTELLGGKGAGLAAMTDMGLPVPPGFTLTTAACRRYLSEGWSDEFDQAVEAGLAELEWRTGKRLGDPESPLLLSVRSGAPVSMPGMMDTVLDVGMTDAVATGLGRLTGDEDFAADTRRRAGASYADIVGTDAPDDPVEQVALAVRAVFDSWTTERAATYRRVEGIDDAVGTAATVQVMVFGNLGPDSGTGVAFTRDPSSGEPGLMGDFLPRAQGEDVVAGAHATLPLADLAETWPQVWKELVRIGDVLEEQFADMVDIEFTVERGRLWLLQARRGKRSPIATFRTAVDMAEDDRFPVDRADAVARCRRWLADPPTVGGRAVPDDATIVATGLPAAPGRAVGVLCLDVDEAVELSEQGADVILVRRETSPSDVHGMAAAVGLVTTLGGLVSHAAVVARSWGLPAVVGAVDLEIRDDAVVCDGTRVAAGETVTVDGDTGRLLLGDHHGGGTHPPEVETVLAWAAQLDADRGGDAGPDVGGSVGDLGFALFHALRIKGMAPTQTLCAMVGAAEATCAEHLERRVEDGSVTFHEGRGLWQITKEGRAAHRDALAAAVAERPLELIDYEQFLARNDDFKALCTDWQVRDGEPNDHTDHDYDRSVVDRLVAHDEACQGLVASFGRVLPWTGRYAARLAAARGRVEAGDEKALTGVLCDSYHDIWMELHEDLILSLGIDRAAEGSA